MTQGNRADDKSGTPRALKIVAGLFVANATLELVTAFINGGSIIRLSTLGFWIGPGLLNRKPRMLRWAKNLLWLDLIVSDMMGLILSFSREDRPVRIGPWRSETSPSLALVFIACMAALSLWQLRVLRRQEIEVLFPDDGPVRLRHVRPTPPLTEIEGSGTVPTSVEPKVNAKIPTNAVTNG